MESSYILIIIVGDSFVSLVVSILSIFNAARCINQNILSIRNN